MKRAFLLFLLPLCLLAGCRHDDLVVAEVHNHKLYASEVGQLVPAGLSRADSADFAQHVIDDWIMEQVILAEAEKEKIKPKDDAELQQTVPVLQIQFKALIARDLWELSEYFTIVNEQSHIVQRALAILG